MEYSLVNPWKLWDSFSLAKPKQRTISVMGCEYFEIRFDRFFFYIVNFKSWNYLISQSNFFSNWIKDKLYSRLQIELSNVQFSQTKNWRPNLMWSIHFMDGHIPISDLYILTMIIINLYSLSQSWSIFLFSATDLWRCFTI